MGTPQVSAQLNVSLGEASAFLTQFYRRFPKVKEWIEGVKRQTKRDGYVRTITGRRRMLEAIKSPVQQERAQAERQAVNSIIQGSAADIMKLAMLKLHDFLKMWKQRSPDSHPKMLLQIHDELLFER